MCAASWVNLQKLKYRGTPLLPKDFVQASAAADMAQKIQLTVPRETWLFLLALAVTTLLLLPVRCWPANGRPQMLALRLAAAAGVLVMLPFYMRGVLYDREFLSRHGVVLAVASLADSYYRGSFVTSFFTLTDSLFGNPAPAGYSEAAVQTTVNIDSDADGQRLCDVFVVLLESYFTLDNFDTATFGEPLTLNFDRLAAEGISGQMLTEFYGGGTGNVEFSVLTGYSNMLLPVGSMPYAEYIREGFLCYPQYLRRVGYTTLALHPYEQSFYNRNNAYPEMGFDRFVSGESFSAADVVGNYVGEQATFTKALELYHEAAADGPVFMHIVTMQNHIPNNPGEYTADHAVQATIPGESDYYNGCLTSVATSLRDIDSAVGAFVDALRNEPRDIVVLFFGDHQTNINGDNGDDLLTHMVAFNALPERERTLRQHVTPYLMWANFETGHEGTDGGLLPSNALLPTMLTAYDVVRPAWMDWLHTEQTALRDLYYDLYFTDEKELLSLMTPSQRQAYDAIALLQYDLMFGKQYAAAALYGKDGG